MEKKNKINFPDREKFNQLLFALYNISPDVEPFDATGKAYNDAALKATNAIYDLLEANPQSGYADGLIVALTLFVETTKAKNPNAYADKEIRRGLI